MISIHLNQLRFHAFHGVFEEERLLGNEYEVDVQLQMEEPASLIEELDQTIDYTQVYDIVSDRMKRPTPLLETIAMEIAGSIRGQFPTIGEINISIRKMHLPVPHFQGHVCVTYRSDKPSK